jgi:hypothetical protein
LRKLNDYYEVVGIAESDPELRKSREKDPAYRDLAWMVERNAQRHSRTRTPG